MRSRIRALVSGILILGNLTFLQTTPAFAATTYSFTNAGATGRTGPTQA